MSINYKLAWYDKVTGFRVSSAWSNLCEHTRRSMNWPINNDISLFYQKITEEFTQFNADFPTVKPLSIRSPTIAKFADQESLTHFLLVWG